jgi:hypothetical protein
MNALPLNVQQQIYRYVFNETLEKLITVTKYLNRGLTNSISWDSVTYPWKITSYYPQYKNQIKDKTAMIWLLDIK